LLAESVFKIADKLSRGIDGRGFSTLNGVEIIDLQHLNSVVVLRDHGVSIALLLRGHEV